MRANYKQELGSFSCAELRSILRECQTRRFGGDTRGTETMPIRSDVTIPTAKPVLIPGSIEPLDLTRGTLLLLRRWVTAPSCHFLFATPYGYGKEISKLNSARYQVVFVPALVL